MAAAPPYLAFLAFFKFSAQNRYSHDFFNIEPSELLQEVVGLLDLFIPVLCPLLHAREGGDHGEQRRPHESAAHVLHLFCSEPSLGEVSDHLCGVEDPGSPFVSGGENARWGGSCHALVSRADDEVRTDLLAVQGHYADGVSPVVEERNIVLPGNPGDAANIVLIGELIINSEPELRRSRCLLSPGAIE